MFQVSLWGGDAVFNNLDLRLDVLEEELRLPFSLVSGHIHELQIHVPWTRSDNTALGICTKFIILYIFVGLGSKLNFALMSLHPTCCLYCGQLCRQQMIEDDWDRVLYRRRIHN